MTAIVFEHVDKSFGSRQVLHRLDFRVEPGEIVGLLGPNGSGKTTTLRLIAGFYRPDAGRVAITACGTPRADAVDARAGAGDHGPDRRDASRRGPGHAIGYLPERAPLYDALTVDHYLQFVARCKGLRGEALRADVDRAVRAFDLDGVRRSAIGRLSKGFRQRVGLAQAILGDPSVLLLDEATNGLDPMQIVEARRMIRAAARGRAVVFSSHLMQEVQALCTRALILRRGRLIADVPLDTDGQAFGAATVALRWRGADEAALRAVVAAIGSVEGVAGVAVDDRDGADDACGSGDSGSGDSASNDDQGSGDSTSGDRAARDAAPHRTRRLVVRYASAPAHLDPLLRAALAHGHVVEARPLSTSVEDLLIDAVRRSDAGAEPLA
ncbi:MAG: ABC transporter ATP-binding protein [Burkholderiaceae bacterium]